jgi:hypothetical protein
MKPWYRERWRWRLMAEGGSMRKALSILWPSFILGGIGTVLLFSLLDPVDLRFVGPFELGRRAGYTLGFFFWGLAAGSSWLTCFLHRTDADANR